MTEKTPKVFANDPIVIATENRHHAVATAIAHLRSGGAHIDPHLRALHMELALGVLLASVRKCALLDNRPLDADRVHTRHLQILALLYGEEPGTDETGTDVA
jgi:hypothetical protein